MLSLKTESKEALLATTILRHLYASREKIQKLPRSNAGKG